MEGPCMRMFPRIVLDHPVELRVANQGSELRDAHGDIGVGGVFVPGAELPLGSMVVIRIPSNPPFEAQGVIRYHGTKEGPGMGIEFTSVSDAGRQCLYELIAQLTLRGLPAA